MFIFLGDIEENRSECFYWNTHTTPAVMICHFCCSSRLRRSVQKAFHACGLWGRVTSKLYELPKAFCYKADKNSTCQLQCSQWSHAVRRLSCVEEWANNLPDWTTAPLVIWRRKRERGRCSKPQFDQQLRRRLRYVSLATTDQLRLLPASDKKLVRRWDPRYVLLLPISVNWTFFR